MRAPHPAPGSRVRMLTMASRQTHRLDLALSILPPRAHRHMHVISGALGYSAPLRRPGLTPRGEQRPAHARNVPLKTESGPAAPQPLPGHGSCPTATSGGRCGAWGHRAVSCHSPQRPQNLSRSKGALRPGVWSGGYQHRDQRPGAVAACLPKRTRDPSGNTLGGIQFIHRSFPQKWRWQNTEHRPSPDS